MSVNMTNTVSRCPLAQFVHDESDGFFKRIRAYDAEIKAIFLLLLLSLINLITSVIGVFAIGIFLLTRKDAAADIFRTGSNKTVFGFLLLTTAVSGICLNIIGVIACVFFFFAIISMLYFMQHITRESFEDFVTLFIGYSVVAAIIGIVEYCVGTQIVAEYRCSSTFANPLYYSYFIVFAILLCIYRVITVKKYRRIYIPLILLNSVGMLFSGGKMPWMGLFVGLFVVLLMKKEYKLLGVFAIFITVMLLLLYFFPNINIFAGLRLNKIDVSYDGRKPYWDMAIKGIFDKPIFGHGMIGLLNDSMKNDPNYLSRFFNFTSLDGLFADMKHHGWKMHAHNIILDSLYSFGIVGSVMLAGYVFKKGLTLFKNCGYLSNNPHFALLCGIIVSIGVNGMVDCEIVGLQTVVFSLLVFAMTGLYAGEKSADTLYKLEPNQHMNE